MNSIKAIETVYAGYRFRSRLEARWAVFFTHLGLNWEYEPEGFDLGGGLRYLPDFRVHFPGGPVWFEVKASLRDISPEEWRKMIAFDIGLGRMNVLVLDGPPGQHSHYLTPGSTYRCWGRSLANPVYYVDRLPDIIRRGWAKDIYLSWDGEDFSPDREEYGRHPCWSAGDKTYAGTTASERQAATVAARGARF